MYEGSKVGEQIPRQMPLLDDAAAAGMRFGFWDVVLEGLGWVFLNEHAAALTEHNLLTD